MGLPPLILPSIRSHLESSHQSPWRATVGWSSPVGCEADLAVTEFSHHSEHPSIQCQVHSHRFHLTLYSHGDPTRYCTQSLSLDSEWWSCGWKASEPSISYLSSLFYHLNHFLFFSLNKLLLFLLFSGHMKKHGWHCYPNGYVTGPTSPDLAFQGSKSLSS